jgi:pilus assembly protein TadC
MAEAESDEADAVRASAGEDRSWPARMLGYVRGVTYLLGSLLMLALLTVGTVGIIAEVKGTWHWAIHLESTISFVGAFVAAVLGLLLPSAAILLVGRWTVDA